METDRLQKPLVLVAEDDRTLADVLRMAFDRAGFEVRIARNGQEAMDMAARTSFDVVCSDYQMPFLNGEQFLTALREGGPSSQAVCILCSAKTYELDSDRLCEQLNLHSVFYKPFSLVELTKAASEGLANRVTV